MSFDLNFPTQHGGVSQLKLGTGEMLFVLGANGTGKSSLMHHFARINAGTARTISAHRQTWMQTDALDMTPANKLSTERSIRSDDQGYHSRYLDQYAAKRASITIYELIDAENVRARKIAACVDNGDINGATIRSKTPAPITISNEMLMQSNLPIEIEIRENQRVMARKYDGPEYSAAELSDGERNVLLLAGNVLTAPSGSLFVIDEPERHLHRSIISPLLKQLFEHRLDCGFLVSTHDHDLPLQMPTARILLLRSCNFSGKNVESWDADELPVNMPVKDDTKRDLLGGRRKILFVEGAEHSLDKSLYSLIFPMVSVIPKGSCRNVEHAVEGARGAESFHWIRAFGIIDGDGYQPEQVEKKREKGVYALPLYSVESIYYHPIVIKYVARRQAKVTGADAPAMTEKALEAAVESISGHTERLSQKVVRRLIRKLITEQLPNDDVLLSGQDVMLKNNAVDILAERKNELDDAVANHNWESILKMCSVRETASRDRISESLRFPTRRDYEDAVRQLIMTDESAVASVRALFGDLFERLSET